MITPLFFLCILILTFGIIFYPRISKHKRNIIKSKKIILKLKEFKHPGQKINYLRKIDPFVFEELLLSAFEIKGYRIIRNKKYTGDGGLDGTIIDEDNNQILIQAKRYKSYIHKQDLMLFQELVQRRNCKGFFIHTGKTSKNSLLFADNEHISIYSGNKLLELLN